MLTASNRYQRALLGSHLAEVRITAYRRNLDHTRTELGRLAISDGTLDINGTNGVWRRLNVRVADDFIGSTGNRASTVLNPNDIEVTVGVGIQFDWSWDTGGPESEYVKIADLRVTRVTKSRRNAVVDVEAVDHGDRVSDATILMPWPNQTQTDETRNVIDAIKFLVNDAYPDGRELNWHVDDTLDDTATYPDDRHFQGDRWTAVNDLAKIIGARVRNNEDGGWVIEPLPVLAVEPAITFDEGVYGTLSTVTLDDDRVDTCSAVTVVCDDPKLGSITDLVVDDNPASPTYYFGPFGKRVYTAENDLAAGGTTDETAAHANVVAVGQALLAQLRGRGKRIEFTGIHNPLIQPGDTVAVRMPDGTLAQHVVDTITLPIPAGSMSVGTRLLEVS